MESVARPKPPTMTQPSASRASAPAPEDRISGTPPSTVEVMVIITGRRRMVEASKMACFTSAPLSRNWLANSTIRIPFLAMMPISITSPIWL